MARTAISREGPGPYYSRFFDEVKKRPALWDRKHEDFNNDDLKNRMWAEMAPILGRDNARQVRIDFNVKVLGFERFINGELKDWAYKSQMHFLKDTHIVVNKVNPTKTAANESALKNVDPEVTIKTEMKVEPDEEAEYREFMEAFKDPFKDEPVDELEEQREEEPAGRETQEPVTAAADELREIDETLKEEVEEPAVREEPTEGDEIEDDVVRAPDNIVDGMEEEDEQMEDFIDNANVLQLPAAPAAVAAEAAPIEQVTSTRRVSARCAAAAPAKEKTTAAAAKKKKTAASTPVARVTGKNGVDRSKVIKKRKAAPSPLTVRKRTSSKRIDNRDAKKAKIVEPSRAAMNKESTKKRAKAKKIAKPSPAAPKREVKKRSEDKKKASKVAKSFPVVVPKKKGAASGNKSQSANRKSKGVIIKSSQCRKGGRVEKKPTKPSTSLKKNKKKEETKKRMIRKLVEVEAESAAARKQQKKKIQSGPKTPSKVGSTRKKR